MCGAAPRMRSKSPSPSQSTSINDSKCVSCPLLRPWCPGRAIRDVAKATRCGSQGCKVDESVTHSMPAGRHMLAVRTSARENLDAIPYRQNCCSTGTKQLNWRCTSLRTRLHCMIHLGGNSSWSEARGLNHVSKLSHCFLFRRTDFAPWGSGDSIPLKP